ncbi:hypothetical protein C8F04DRAFT_1404682 [Mycena alexandri]|uniref:Cation-transporting P-type ATPase N-terminal domain-containing protein n=1 Tax=Mycena alexandri TaxID=1745969 RepID=A0AAD6S0K1_9AGAR|nr:hypothetical protein C8F04DRAFT_1404682 [Mycena alexandri]
MDLTQAPLLDVYKHLKCDENGLTSDEAARRLEQFKLHPPRQRQSRITTQFLGFLWNPISWTLQVIAVGLLVLSSGSHRPPDWPSFLGSIVLLCINCALGVFTERRAYGAVTSLVHSAPFAATPVRIKRDGVWSEYMDASGIVPGDIISLGGHDINIVPANCRLVTGSLWILGRSYRDLGAQLCQGWEIGSGHSEAVVIDRSRNHTPPPSSSPATGLHGIVAQIGTFCLSIIAVSLVIELLALYAGFHYSYHRGVNAIFVLLIGSIPIALPTGVSIILSVGIADLARCEVLTTRVAAVAELAGVTVLCVEPAALTEDHEVASDIRTYGPFGETEVLLMSTYGRSKRSPTSPSHRGEYYDQGPMGHDDIDIVHFRPLSVVGGPMQVTYHSKGSTQLKRIAKGMLGHIIEMSTRNRTNALEQQVEADIEEFVARGLPSLGLAYEELEGDNPTAEGNGFEVIGVLGFSRPLRENTEQAVAELLRIGIEMKIVSGNQLSNVKETGRRIGLGDKMFPGRVFKEENLDARILEANGFAGLFPEHTHQLLRHLQHMGQLCAMIGRGTSTSAVPLSTADLSITVNSVSVLGDLVTTQPCLPKIVEAIRNSRQVFQRLRACFIYSCAITIRTTLCFSLVAFIYKIDFPPFMMLLVALATNLATLTLCVDRVVAGGKPSRWNLKEIFGYSTVYGVYMALSTILFLHASKTNFFHQKFNLTLSSDPPARNNQLNTLIYLQVTQISHALIFVLRSERFSFSHRPSVVLLGVFSVAQITSSVIASYGNWSFARIHPVGAGWIGLVWVWNMIWFIPLDFVKFGVRLALRIE